MKHDFYKILRTIAYNKILHKNYYYFHYLKQEIKTKTTTLASRLIYYILGLCDIEIRYRHRQRIRNKLLFHTIHVQSLVRFGIYVQSFSTNPPRIEPGSLDWQSVTLPPEVHASPVFRTIGINILSIWKQTMSNTNIANTDIEYQYIAQPYYNPSLDTLLNIRQHV